MSVFDLAPVSYELPASAFPTTKVPTHLFRSLLFMHFLHRQCYPSGPTPYPITAAQMPVLPPGAYQSAIHPYPPAMS